MGRQARRTQAPVRAFVMRPLRVSIAGVLVMLVVAVTLSALVQFHFKPAARAQATIRVDLDAAQTAALNQETGLRGWVVTHDDRFLQPFTSGLRAQKAAYAALLPASADDAQEHAAVLATWRAERAWFRRWAFRALRHPPPRGDRAALTASLLHGKRLFDRYRGTQRHAAAVVSDREARASNQETVAVAAAAGIDALVALVCALLVVRSYRRMRAAVLPPVAAIRSGLSGLLSGAGDTRVEVTGPQEFGEIAADVNDLADRLQQRDRDIAARERALISARELAEQAGQAKAAFLATMSHEIRTPLNAVLGMTDLLLAADPTPEQHRQLEIIATSGDSLLSLINDVLDYSKIEAGELELEDVPFEVADCVAAVADLFAVQAAESDVDLLVDTTGVDGVWVTGDVNRLRQVLVNLVGNALKFTARGEVLLEARSRRTVTVGGDESVALTIRVRDTGIGIPAERIPSLFEPFRQADASTTRRFGGTGLGLTICQRLVTAMHGTIDVRSRVDAGSTFTVDLTLPVAAMPVRAVSGGGAPDGLDGVTVLVVDDNATNRTILRAQLERFGARCVVVADGPSALAVLDGTGPDATGADPVTVDIMLIDLHMPGMDGVAVARRVLARPGRPPARVLLSSAALDVRDRDLFDARLQKPARPVHLRHTLLAVLDRTVPEAVAATAPSRQGEPLRVLVAEDNPVNRDLMQAYLRRLGHETAVVETGIAAVHAVERKRFDVVVMDGQMPQLDGWEATRLIRALPVPQPYVLAVTASVFSADRDAFLAAGADAFLAKPIRLTVLETTLRGVRAVLDERAAASPPQEDLTMDESVAAERRPSPVAAALDPEMLEELTELGAEIAAPLLTGFRDGLGERLAALDDADPHVVARALHSLKGSAGSFGARTLAQACAEAEVAVKAGGGPGEVAPLLHEVRSEADRAAHEIGRVVAELSAQL